LNNKKKKKKRVNKKKYPLFLIIYKAYSIFIVFL